MKQVRCQLTERLFHLTKKKKYLVDVKKKTKSDLKKKYKRKNILINKNKSHTETFS